MQLNLHIAAKARVTLVLLFWAVLCLTTLSNRSSVFDREFSPNISNSSVVAYFSNNLCGQCSFYGKNSLESLKD